ncbi:MAG: asparaginase domain-containing protein [Parcubacteria group bacterium]
MARKRSKIGIIFCGGSGLQTASGSVIEVRKKDEMTDWLKEVPELGIIAEAEPHFVFGGDASEVTPEIWQQLARKINEIYSTVDGIVITHGLDTVLYTGSMLSFMLQNLGKPVVLTSSPLFKEMQSPQELEGLVADYRNLGVRANLINAFQVATMDIAEVVVAYGNRILRANQTVKSIHPTINYFDDFADGLLGKVDFGIKLFPHAAKRSKAKLRLEGKIGEGLATFRVDPLTRPEALGSLLSSGCKAVLVRSYSANLFPDSFKPYLRLAYEKGVPIIAYNLNVPEKKKERDEYIVVNNMTYEATMAKCLWMLGKTTKPAKFRELLSRDTAHELRSQSV